MVKICNDLFDTKDIQKKLDLFLILVTIAILAIFHIDGDNLIKYLVTKIYFNAVDMSFVVHYFIELIGDNE